MTLHIVCSIISYIVCEVIEIELIDIKILNTAIERLLNQALTEYNITYTQSTVISFLLRNSDKIVCQKDIETSLGLTTPTVNSILKRMEKKELVEVTIQSDDKRFKSIKATKKAEEISGGLKEKISVIQQKLSTGIPKGDTDFFSIIIHKMIDNLNQD